MYYSIVKLAAIGSLHTLPCSAVTLVLQQLTHQTNHFPVLRVSSNLNKQHWPTAAATGQYITSHHALAGDIPYEPHEKRPLLLRCLTGDDTLQINGQLSCNGSMYSPAGFSGKDDVLRDSQTIACQQSALKNGWHYQDPPPPWYFRQPLKSKKIWR